MSQGFEWEYARDALTAVFRSTETKGTKPVWQMSAHLMDLLVIEALERAQNEALQDRSESVTLEHLQRILPQLLLDFF